jgi:hypothetical protein
MLREAERLKRTADEAGVTVRFLGGIAVSLHSHEGLQPSLARSFGDIEIVVPRAERSALAELVAGLGYVPNKHFNALNGRRRLAFYLPKDGIDLDVLVGESRTYHVVPLESRLGDDDPTIPLAELLLTKLQVEAPTEKDLIDIWAMLSQHAVGEADRGTVNAARIAQLLAADWGLWRTVSATVEVAASRLAGIRCSEHTKALIVQRLDLLWERVQREPKGARWWARAKVGDKVRWYKVPVAGRNESLLATETRDRTALPACWRPTAREDLGQP